MQDRLEIPATLEKALEYSKHQPSHAKLSQQKARDWETVVQRGRRSMFWSKWKPVTAVLAGAAVVMAAVLLPSFPGLGGPQQVAEEGSLSSPAVTTGGVVLDEKTKQIINAYQKQGYQMVTKPNDFGVDVITDRRDIYAMKNGVKTKLLSMKRGEQVLGNDNPRIPYLILFIASDPVAGQEYGTNQLYLLDYQDLSVKPLKTTGVINMYHLVDKPDLHVFYSTYDFIKNRYVVISQDLKTGQEKELYQSEKSFAEIALGQNSVTVSNQDEIVMVTEQGTKQIAKSERKEMRVRQVVDGSYVLYETGLKNPSNQFAYAYSTTPQVMQYNLKTDQSQPLLPDVEGNQFLIHTSPQATSTSAKVIGNFVPDKGSDLQGDSYKITGTLQLWEAYGDGRAPHLMYERKTKWGEQWTISDGSAEGNNRYLLKSLNNKWKAVYDEAKGTIEEILPQQATK